MASAINWWLVPDVFLASTCQAFACIALPVMVRLTSPPKPPPVTLVPPGQAAIAWPLSLPLMVACFKTCVDTGGTLVRVAVGGTAVLVGGRLVAVGLGGGRVLVDVGGGAVGVAVTTMMMGVGDDAGGSGVFVGVGEFVGVGCGVAFACLERW